VITKKCVRNTDKKISKKSTAPSNYEIPSQNVTNRVIFPKSITDLALRGAEQFGTGAQREIIEAGNLRGGRLLPIGRRRRQSDARGAASGWVSVGSALTAASVAVADAEDVGRRGSCVATAGRWGCVACVAARNTPSSIVSDARLNPFADRRLIALIFTR